MYIDQQGAADAALFLGETTGGLATAGWQQVPQQREANALPADIAGAGCRHQQQGVAFRDAACSLVGDSDGAG